MRLLRNSLLVFGFLCTCACETAVSEIEISPDPFVFVSALHRGQHGKQVIFTANPGDCINCLNLLQFRLGKARRENQNQVTVVLREHRAVERRQLYNTILSGIDTTIIPVIWNDSLYNAINREYAGKYPGQSLLLIYDESGKKILCKPVKEIRGDEPETAELFQ
ncbi:MAG: hypothetical protein FD123_2692 [Bacteroidetes bacterium]|nr:MAG: hypothetical protein FD123_2692 [Bacteroidota bacterium]